MVPQTTFFAWIVEGTSNKRAYDSRVMKVGLEDRALVILRANVSEVTRSDEAVGVEIFAEPDSQICVLGTKASPPKPPRSGQWAINFFM